MDKKELVNEIANNFGFVFGGYVRDTIAGKSTNDIDCCIDPKYRFSFKKFLLRHFGSFGVLALEYYCSNYDNSIHLERFVVHGDEQMQIDVVSNLVFSPDFDINTLRLNRYGLNSFLDYLSVPKILENIRNGKARKLIRCTDKREEKMRMKGWEIIV